MAGERYAKLTLRAAWSWNINVRGRQTQAVRLRLGGQWVTIERGGNPGQYVVPEPGQFATPREFVLHGIENFLAALRQAISQRGLSYSVSVPRDAGDDPSHVGTMVLAPNVEIQPWPIVEFDVTANLYDAAYDLDFQSDWHNGESISGWQIAQNLPTIRPVQLTTRVLTPAGIYGSATGYVQVEASNGSTGHYTYSWADLPAWYLPWRSNLVGPASYTVTATDASGASASLTVAVGSDPRLEVLAEVGEASATLLISGGLPPYQVAWADGPTTATRANLEPGSYEATVTDSRGASVTITVELERPPYFFSRNAITLPLDAGDDYRADPSTKPNLSFLCEVWVEPVYLSEEFVQVGTTLEQPADSQGRTTFEVQALLDAYLDYHVPLPGMKGVQPATALFRRFYLRHAEQYGTPPEPAQLTTLERHYVLRGGLDFYAAAARTWFTSYQAATKPFLTWEPTIKPVLLDQPEFLYFQVQDPSAGLRVQLRVGYADGSTLEGYGASAHGLRAWEVYCLAVGYQALGLDDYAAYQRQDVAWWEVWVGSDDGQGQVLSEVRRYELRRRRYPHRRYLLFATSLGGMATYAALGEAQLEAEVTGEEVARALPPGYDALAGDVGVQQRQLRPVLKLASGPRTTAQLAASRDLLLARRVLLLLPEGRWQPGFVKAKTSTILDENKLVPVQELEFVQPVEQLYTPALAVRPFRLPLLPPKPAL